MDVNSAGIRLCPKNSVQTFATDPSGSIAVIGAVSMAVLLGAVGIAMTSAVVYHEQAEFQRSLDAAVLGAASIQGDISDDDRLAAAGRIFRDNLTAGNLTTEGSSSLATSAEATTFAMQEHVVQGESTAMVKNLFSGIVGPASLPFTVRSAASAAAAVPVCVLALDPTSPQGIEIYGVAHFTA